MPSTRSPMAVAFTMRGRCIMSVLEDATPLAIIACDDGRFAIHHEPAPIEPDEAIALGLQKIEVVRHEHGCHPARAERVDARAALIHEELIAHAEHLIDEQDVGLYVEG